MQCSIFWFDKTSEASWIMQIRVLSKGSATGGRRLHCCHRALGLVRNSLKGWNCKTNWRISVSDIGRTGWRGSLSNVVKVAASYAHNDVVTKPIHAVCKCWFDAEWIGVNDVACDREGRARRPWSTSYFCCRPVVIACVGHGISLKCAPWSCGGWVAHRVGDWVTHKSIDRLD